MVSRFTFTRDTLRTAYAYLAETRPFVRWNLPDSEDVTFRVARSPAHYGWHTFDGEKHEIAVSARNVTSATLLLSTMAHEMIHVHEAEATTRRRDVHHSATFKRWAAQVCAVHGFDLKGFV